MRIGRYNGEEFPIEDDKLTIDEIKANLAQVYPELENATHVLNGEFVDFSVAASTKG